MSNNKNVIMLNTQSFAEWTVLDMTSKYMYNVG